MTTAKIYAVLIVCDRVIGRWPVQARVALRQAVLKHVDSFAAEPWNEAEIQMAAEVFFDRWKRGLPWPPPTDVAEPATDDVRHLADLAAILGVDLAAAWLREL